MSSKGDLISMPTFSPAPAGWRIAFYYPNNSGPADIEIVDVVGWVAFENLIDPKLSPDFDVVIAMPDGFVLNALESTNAYGPYGPRWTDDAIRSNVRQIGHRS